MPVGKNQVGPSIVVQIEEGVSPSNVGRGAAGDARFVGDIGKAQGAVVAKQRGVLFAEVSDR